MSGVHAGVDLLGMGARERHELLAGNSATSSALRESAKRGALNYIPLSSFQARV